MFWARALEADGEADDQMEAHASATINDRPSGCGALVAVNRDTADDARVIEAVGLGRGGAADDDRVVSALATGDDSTDEMRALRLFAIGGDDAADENGWRILTRHRDATNDLRVRGRPLSRSDDATNELRALKRLAPRCDHPPDQLCVTLRLTWRGHAADDGRVTIITAAVMRDDGARNS